MAEDLVIVEGSRKERYISLLPQIKALVEGETDLVANLANVAAALREQFGWLWVGFYLVRNGELLVTALEKNSISREAFDRELRVNDLRSVADVAEARLEPTGRITFLRRGPVDRQ